MNTPKGNDPLPGLAVRLYAVHSAIHQLQERAPRHLSNEFAMLIAKIESFGGSVVPGEDVFGEVGPVAKDKDGNIFSYASGRMESERIISAVLDAKSRQP